MTVSYDQVRDWVLALPGGAEVYVESWGHPTLRYAGKMFASGGGDSGTITVKASREEQAELVATAPHVYSPAPYVGRYGWVTVVLAEADPDEARQLVTEAWRRTAPKKVVRAYDSAQG
ncbi:MmcQ/YjbR family DNA-binding protein [Actinoplanes sp. NPDC049599]|uniref:MmcQ/YjbR family DNA-binding protein n=1 Tax=Actinoplanes sp. NPDC049599 TaxID=3363903 RepID=UPI0037AA0A3D